MKIVVNVPAATIKGIIKRLGKNGLLGEAPDREFVKNKEGIAARVARDIEMNYVEQALEFAIGCVLGVEGEEHIPGGTHAKIV
jgi:hypothetical protein